MALVGRWLLNEGSGTSAADRSGNGYTGTFQGTAGWVAGGRAQTNAADFPGTDNNVVTVEDNSAFQGLTAVTAMAWVRTDANPGTDAWHAIIGRQGTTTGDNFVIAKTTPSWLGGAAHWYVGVDGSTGDPGFYTTNGSPGTTATWRHVALTYNSTDGLKLYVDGVSVAATSGSGTAAGTMTSFSSRKLIIGGNANNAGDYGTDNAQDVLDGRIEDARVYDTALTAAEIAFIYNSAPRVQSVSATANNGTDGPTGGVAVTQPSGVAVGDLLVCVVGQDMEGAANTVSATGWTQINTAANGTATRLTFLGRIATGADTCTIVSTAAQDYTAFILRISDHDVTSSTITTAIKVGTAVTATTATPNPPATPTLALGDWLVVTATAVDTQGTSKSITATPTNYTSHATGTYARSASSTSSVLVGAASRRLGAITTEDPGTFSTTTSYPTASQTIAVPMKGPVSLSGGATVAVPAGSGTGLTFTGAAAFTLSGTGTVAVPTGSGTGLTNTAPVYSLSGGGTIAVPSSTGTLTYRSLSTFTGTGTIGAPTGGGTGLTNTAPVYTVSGSGTISVPTGSGAGLTNTAPVYTVSGSGSVPVPAGAGAGLQYTSLSNLSGSGSIAVPAGSGGGLTNTNPVYSLSGSTTIGAPTGSGAGLTNTAPSYTLSGGASIAAPSSTGSLANTAPTYTLGGTGTIAVPSSTGSLANTAPVYTVSGNGTIDVPAGSGAGLTSTAPGTFTLSGNSTIAAPIGSGAGLVFASASALSGSATIEVPASSGSVTFTAPTYIISGAGTIGAPSCSGDLAVTAPTYVISGAGTIAAPAGSGTLTYVSASDLSGNAEVSVTSAGTLVFIGPTGVPGRAVIALQPSVATVANVTPRATVELQPAVATITLS